MARVAIAVLALALIAAVPAAHAVTLITNTMSSPYVGFTGPLGGGMKVVSCPARRCACCWMPKYYTPFSKAAPQTA